jgi:hypothetical protein
MIETRSKKENKIKQRKSKNLKQKKDAKKK